MFWKPGGICRHLQHQGTYLFTSMLQRNTFRKQQESSALETWEETSSCNSLGFLPTIFFATSTFRVLRDDFSLCPSCHQCEKLLLGSSLASSHKILTVLWQGSCYLWQLVLFQCPFLLLAVKGRNYHHLFTAASYDCFWKHFQTFPKVQADHLARNLLWTQHFE